MPYEIAASVFLLLMYLAERFLVRELILHGQVAELKSSDLSDNLAHNPRERFPLLFFALLPMVLPEVLIRFKDWQLINVDRNVAATCSYQCMEQESCDVLRCLDVIGAMVIEHNRPDSSQ
jgi:hypothetical protein